MRDAAYSRTVFEVLTALLEAGRSSSGTISSSASSSNGASNGATAEDEVAVVRAMRAVVAHGALSATFVATAMLGTLCACAGYGAHVEDGVVDVLACALRRVPETLVDVFIERSFKFESALFVRAVARCAAADLDWWLAHCAMVKTVCYAVVQYACLRADGARAAAMALANLLAGDAAAQHEGGRFHTRQCLTEALANHTSPTVDFVHPLNARRYSDALAARNPLATPAFLGCVAQWFDALGDVGKHAVLQLLPAWLANYQTVFADDHDQAPLVASVLAVARSSFRVGLLGEVEALWRALVAPAATTDAVAFLVHRLVAAATHARAAHNTAERECATFALACLGRTPAHRMVWDALAQHWPHYPALEGTATSALAPLPLPQTTNREAREAEEMAAVQMAVSLLSERPRECPDEHLAVLLQTVHVRCRTSADATDRLVGVDTLNFALGAVLQDERESDRWAAASALVARPTDTRWAADALLATVALLDRAHPRLCACWRAVALDWAAALPDDARAVDALHIAALLWLRVAAAPPTAADVRALVPRLQALVLRYAAAARPVALTAALDAVCSIPPALRADAHVWPRLVVSAAALLESPCATIYAAACDTLRDLLLCRVQHPHGGDGGDDSEDNHVDEAEAERDMVRLGLAPLAREGSVRLCAVLLRGTLAAPTLAGALWLGGLVARHARALLSREACDAVAVVGTLVHAVLVATHAVGAGAAAQRFAAHALPGCFCFSDDDGNDEDDDGDNAAAAQTLAHAFAAMDESARPVAQQHAAHTLLAAHLFPAFVRVFARRAPQRLAVDTLLALVRKGPRRWRPALLDLLALFVGAAPTAAAAADGTITIEPFSAAQRLHAAEVVTLAARCAGAPPALADAADRALVALLARPPVPRGCTMRFFDCTHSVPPAPAPADEPPAELFGALYPEEAVVLTARCAQAYATRAFTVCDSEQGEKKEKEEEVPLAQCTLLDAARLRAALQAPVPYPYDALASRRARTPPATAPAHERRPFDQLPVHVLAGVAAQADFAAVTQWW